MILHAANELFLKHGYQKTSMREVAAKSGLGLGLITYYYKTKVELAKACLKKHFHVIEDLVASAVSFGQDVLLYHAAYLRFTHWYFMRSEIQGFYYECLENGIYEEFISETVPRTLREINIAYKSGYSDDYVLLYGNYLPVSLEKILTVQKRNGLFRQISDDDIPTIVFETAISRFVPDKALIWAKIQKSISVCDSLKQKALLEPISD